MQQSFRGVSVLIWLLYEGTSYNEPALGVSSRPSEVHFKLVLLARQLSKLGNDVHIRPVSQRAWMCARCALARMH